MSTSGSDDVSQTAPASLNARKIEQLASRLCVVQERGDTSYCATHGNVVANQSAICGHVRIVVDQIVQAVMDSERVRMPAAESDADSGPVEVRMEVSA